MKKKLPALVPHLKVVRSQVFATSLDVAEKFEKKHKNVLQAIEKIECSEEFNRLNFQLVTYVDAKGESRPMYHMTRDGFSFLAMGFTGKKAAMFKEMFIRAFNDLEKAIVRQKNLDFQQLRLQGKQQRHELTDAIQQFVQYAREQGSRSADKYYMNVTKMTYKCLGLIKDNTPSSQNFRDLLDTASIGALQMAEYVAEGAILEGMELGMPYKEIFQYAKSKVEAFASTVLPRLQRGGRPKLLAS